MFVHTFEEIISLENLFCAWEEFLRGKRSKPDVQSFERNLAQNVFSLHHNLRDRTYRHGGYYSFIVSDPKPRHIHKASVRDRLLHHAIYRMLYPYFDTRFIADLYSCRLDKGTHRAVDRLRSFILKAGRNNTRTCWALQCDVRKFFASSNHQVLLDELARHIADKDILWLLQGVIGSFSTMPGKGLPLGNLTSQLFVNVYMNIFDQFVKHCLGARYYIRYADDFLILSDDRQWLEDLIPAIQYFLSSRLDLVLHPNKVTIRTASSGISFLGWVQYPTHRIVRTRTKNRMMRRMCKNPREESIQSYLGLLNHGNTYALQREVRNFWWLNPTIRADA